jgi:peptide/nickel transport system ATP-binding protein
VTAPAPARSAHVEPILEVENLKVHFPITEGFLRRTVGHVKAVDDVRSPCTRARRWPWSARAAVARPRSASLRVHDVTAGQIAYHRRDHSSVDLSLLDTRARKPYR